MASPPNGHETEQTTGDSEGQGSLVCCSPWGHKDMDTAQQLKQQWHSGKITNSNLSTGY